MEAQKNTIGYYIQLKKEESLKGYFFYKIIRAKNGMVDFAKFLYLVLVLVLLLSALLELKTIYNVDIFPGVDTPFDNYQRVASDAVSSNLL
ncbi:MAG: hypothetical protein EBZ58_07090 [Bacteroidetes bacterium]|jgi:hypothetical protein|nr:hypothetical protein [Bacteroidota bacterium]